MCTREGVTWDYTVNTLIEHSLLYCTIAVTLPCRIATNSMAVIYGLGFLFNTPAIALAICDRTCRN